MKMNRGSILAASISLCCFSSAAQAGGFSVTIQSASGGGNAATGHAMAEDASAMFYNPALLSSIEGTQVNTGVAFTHADLSVKNTGSTLGENTGPLNGFPIVGTNDEPSTASNDAEPGGLSATPSLFYKRDIGAQKKVAFGLGINIPFGVATEYDDVSFARYEGTESGLTTVNINPALSWRANDKWDFGAGLNLQYGHAILAKAIDGALACQSIAGAAAAGGSPAAASIAAACSTDGGALGFTGYSNAETDSDISVEASGIAFGANIGAAYHPTKSTTLSFGYRSSVKYDLEGEADITHKNLAGLGDATLNASGLGDQDAEAELELPASASFSFATKMTNALTVHGDVTWTQWSSMPEIRIEFPDTALADSVTSLDWEDTVRVGAGMTYQLNPKTKLRAGIAFDPTPTPSAEHRTPRAPRSDSYWFSMGASHQFSKKLGVDASLSYIYPEDTTIDYTAPGATDSDPTGYYTSADVEADAIALALSVNYKF
ncbi:OmpP1/FadL family transporter [Leucothrix mucor]|uniref:OmpP1/FadL family transporter n=1 Tax=Leucothrix mucor TaxID=45248 RepID=UPI0003B30030|nr:outer membrane protein transport protein [Leucothrix mucor]